MPALNEILHPLEGGAHRRALVDIHRYLRDLILTNALPPETVLSQVEVANCLGVSRTPVREALRKLQEEGLIDAQPNYRCRVLGFNPQELEALYVGRITNEGIAAVLTVERMDEAALSELGAVLADLETIDPETGLARWIATHRVFHEMLFHDANPALRQRMHFDCERGERYLYNAMLSRRTDLFRRAVFEHRQIAEACRQRRPAQVVALLTDHLSRAALDIIAELAPHWEPATLRIATRLMLAGAAHF